MNVKLLKIFGAGLTLSEIAAAAESAAKTLKGKRISLPVADSVYGHGFEILLFDDNALYFSDGTEDVEMG